MIKVQRHFHKGNPEIVRLCGLSQELYNRCNYLMRKVWFTPTASKFKPLPSISVLKNYCRTLDCYKKIGNVHTAMQIIRMVLSDWSNYLKSIRAYKINPSKFIKCPKPPKYKEKLAQVIFFRLNIKDGQAKKQPTTLTANNSCFSLPFVPDYKQVVITPKAFGFMIDVIYEDKESEVQNDVKVSKKKVCCIDLGLNCLAAITFDENRPILINGRILKSINQWYNKRQCKSRLRKRYFRIENYFHHVSKFIIDLCLENGIGKIIIGKNDGWKQEINLGKKTNQAFSCIPHYLLLQKIQYKAAAVGIEVLFTEEAYTSKASFYDRDPLPKFGEEPPEFSGTRKHRGLYITKNNFAVNADVNASMNIGRKVIPESFGIRDRSLAARPVAINPLRYSTVKVA